MPRPANCRCSSPLGSTLAVLAWAPGAATLRSNGQTQQFESVDALVARRDRHRRFPWRRCSTGCAASTRRWRAGSADLSQLGQGRLAALRQQPPPEADLRVVFER